MVKVAAAMRPAASWPRKNPDGLCALLLPAAEVVFVEPEGKEVLAVLEEPLLGEDGVAVEYLALAEPLLPSPGHDSGNCVLHADPVQDADEEAYSEPTDVAVQ